MRLASIGEAGQLLQCLERLDECRRRRFLVQSRRRILRQIDDVIQEANPVGERALLLQKQATCMHISYS